MFETKLAYCHGTVLWSKSHNTSKKPRKKFKIEIGLRDDRPKLNKIGHFFENLNDFDFLKIPSLVFT
jgi:hypothetical protein